MSAITDFISGFGTGWSLMDDFMTAREERIAQEGRDRKLEEAMNRGGQQSAERLGGWGQPGESGRAPMPHEQNLPDPQHNQEQRRGRGALATDRAQTDPSAPEERTPYNPAERWDRTTQRSGDPNDTIADDLGALNFTGAEALRGQVRGQGGGRSAAIQSAQAEARSRREGRTSGSNAQRGAIPAGYGGQREEVQRQMGDWSDLDSREVASYIRRRAPDFGIDGDAAVRVAMTEGLTPSGVHGQSTVERQGSGSAGGYENSWGPFQLYLGGGLGNEFKRRTGMDPRDPNTWREQVDFSLREAGRLGHWYDPNNRTAGPWFGPRDAKLPHNFGFSGSRQAAIPASR